MKKSDIREYLGGFFKRPKSKWEAWLAFWDRLIISSMGTLLTISAFLTANGGFLIFLVVSLGALLFVLYYFVAKGK